MSQIQRAFVVGAFQMRRGACMDGLVAIDICIFSFKTVILRFTQDLCARRTRSFVSLRMTNPRFGLYNALWRSMSSVEPKKVVGWTRMAAPVGQAWTHAWLS